MLDLLLNNPTLQFSSNEASIIIIYVFLKRYLHFLVLLENKQIFSISGLPHLFDLKTCIIDLSSSILSQK